MKTLELTDRELMALTYSLQLAYNNHHNNWHNEIETILNQLRNK